MRLIDADKMARNSCVKTCANCEDFFKEITVKCSDMRLYILELIEQQRTVDAVPVIRCKECKLYYPIENHKHGHCAMFNFTHTDEDDYCSSAERRDDD